MRAAMRGESGDRSLGSRSLHHWHAKSDVGLRHLKYIISRYSAMLMTRFQSGQSDHH